MSPHLGATLPRFAGHRRGGPGDTVKGDAGCWTCPIDGTPEAASARSAGRHTITSTTIRSRRAAAAALAGAALLLLTACSGGATDATELTLPADAGPAVICAELTPASLANADLAIRATVRSIEGDRVTLEVEETYTGEPGDSVVLPQQEDGQPAELSIGAFAEGSTYLLASIDGAVLTCGASGPVSSELQAIYDEAF